MSEKFVPQLFRSRNANLVSVLAKWSLFVIFISAVLLASPRTRVHANSANIRLCGEKLVKMVTAICKGCIQGSKMDVIAKRASTPDLLKGSHSEFSSIKRNFFHNEENRDETYGIRQTRRAGIATECCDKMCTYGYLKSFCCDS